MSVTVSTRGQTVIPSEIRRRYHIGHKTRLEFIDTGKEIIMVPVPPDSFTHSRGILKGVSTRDLLSARRKERASEHAKR
jgi:AbrB family looped-hinge helix DNA binding protein